MPSPTIKSGHADAHRKAVARPAAMMATFARASLRAERCGSGQAAAMVAVARQHESAGEIDGQRPRTCQRQRSGVGGYRRSSFPTPSTAWRGRARAVWRPEHANPGPRASPPAERHQNEQVDRRILKEVDAVCEQRHRADHAGNSELNPEIGKVQDRDEPNDPPQIMASGCS